MTWRVSSSEPHRHTLCSLIYHGDSPLTSENLDFLDNGVRMRDVLRFRTGIILPGCRQLDVLTMLVVSGKWTGES